MSDEFNPMAVRDSRSMSEKKVAVRDMDAHPESVARDQLRSFVERIERLEEDKAAINDDIKQVYGEAGSCGFDKKVVRRVVAIRKQDPQERMQGEAILSTYLAALGME